MVRQVFGYLIERLVNCLVFILFDFVRLLIDQVCLRSLSERA